MDTPEREVVNTLRAIELSSYSFCAATALYAHHFLTTIALEVDSVWRAPWTLMKVLYLINRYFGLAVVVINAAIAWLQTAGHMCDSFHWFVDPAVTLSTMLVQVILQVRIHAILGNRQNYINAITLLFIIEIVFIIILSIQYSKTSITTFSDIKFCDTQLSLSLVPAIIFDAIMAAIIIYRAVLHVKKRRHMDVPVSWGYGGRLLVTLARDSIQYYICIILVFTVVVLRDFRSSNSLNVDSLLLFPWVAVVPTASATSMILHLHEVARAGHIPTSVQRTSSSFELRPSHSIASQGAENAAAPEHARKPRLHLSWMPADWANLTMLLPSSPIRSLRRGSVEGKQREDKDEV